jgi:uncharacterized membrane protein YhhN
MISLVIYYFMYARNFSTLFFTALVGALLGDIFLMWDGELFFILGLGSFLVMQVLYSIYFFKERDKTDVLDIFGGVIILIVAGWLMYIILPKVEGVISIAVPIYCLCIAIMVTTSIGRNRALVSYVPILCGAVLFMISDAVLAIDKFAIPIENATFLTMGTYMVAQYFIVRGIADDRGSD